MTQHSLSNIKMRRHKRLPSTHYSLFEVLAIHRAEEASASDGNVAATRPQVRSA
jgi:hypothetical protein